MTIVYAVTNDGYGNNYIIIIHIMSVHCPGLFAMAVHLAWQMLLITKFIFYHIIISQ